MEVPENQGLSTLEQRDPFIKSSPNKSHINCGMPILRTHPLCYHSKKSWRGAAEPKGLCMLKPCSADLHDLYSSKGFFEGFVMDLRVLGLRD